MYLPVIRRLQLRGSRLWLKGGIWGSKSVGGSIKRRRERVMRMVKLERAMSHEFD